MNKIKQIFSILSLISMVTTASVSAMEENPGQLPVTQAVISTCGQSIWNAFSVAHYGVNMVAAEARYLPDAINSVLTHIVSSHNEEQNEVKLDTNGFNLSVYQVLATIQNGAYYGVNYAHNAINGLFNHIALGDE
jgi:hypothetical protein